MPDLFSREAERSLLGSMLLGADVIVPQSIDLGIDHTVHYETKHRFIHKAILDCWDERIAPDLVTVSDRLERSKLLPACGGVEYLSELLSDVSTVSDASGIIATLKDYSTRRKLVRAGQDIIRAASEPQEGQDIVGVAQDTIRAATDVRGAAECVTIKEAMPAALSQIESYFNPDVPKGYWQTGFVDLDKSISGLFPAELACVAGRPSMGKSALMSLMATNIARAGQTVLVFSIEMSLQMNIERILSSEARVDLRRLRSGTASQADLGRVRMMTEALDIPLYIDPTSRLSCNDIVARCSRTKPKVVMIDYIQLMRGDGKNDHERLTSISHGLKNIAKEFNCAVVEVSQLARESERRGGDRRPMLSDLRASGSIEEDADTVMFVHRPEYYGIKDDNFGSTMNRADIIIAKQRNGPTGVVFLNFRKEYTRFENRQQTTGQEVDPSF